MLKRESTQNIKRFAKPHAEFILQFIEVRGRFNSAYQRTWTLEMIDKNYHMGCIATTKLFLHIPSRTISSIGFLKDHIKLKQS